MARHKLTEREEEALEGSKTFSIKLPRPEEKYKKEEMLPAEKTSLFVPKDKLVNEENGFGPSSFSSEVLVSKNIQSVLKTIFKYGDVAKRYGEGGLENDPTRQQVIIYAAVVCNGNLLWYQRPDLKAELKKKFVGDTRLQGRFSVGFGGHKTEEDFSISRLELVFLKDVLSGVEKEVSTLLGLNKGLFSEVEEEIGLKRNGVKSLKLLGSFFDGRYEDPFVNVQVGWVHTGIAAILEVDKEAVEYLTFRKSEVAKVWWVPFNKVLRELRVREKDWQRGKGSKVETWTEVVLKEFWTDFIKSF